MGVSDQWKQWRAKLKKLVVDFLQEPLQSAYRQHHSCETAILKVHDDIIRALDDNKIVALVLLDMSSAFDTVNHEYLLATLHHLGIRDIALRWFETYLSDRTQSVLVNSSRSESEPVSCGVPQGSVLGPLLFTVYTLGLGRIIRRHHIDFHLYADDSQVYIASTPEELPSAIKTIEDCLVDIRNWLCSHRLKLNESKTEFLLISSRSTAPQLINKHLSIGGHDIEPAKTVRNLGVVMDSNAVMEDHVKRLCCTAYGQLRAIHRIKNCVDAQTLEVIIHAFISSRLDFSNGVLSGITQRLLQKVQHVQNAAARILTKQPMHAHITPILQSLHWLPVASRVQYKILIIVHKCLYGDAPVYLRNMLQWYTPGRSLRSRNSNKLVIPMCNHVRSKQAFSVAGPTLWNSIPSDLQNESNFISFKSKLKTYLFATHFN